MYLKRKLVHIDTAESQPGFLGRGHTARPVIQRDFAESDPFILLMDDILDKQDDEPAGGPHPHAGFETVSLLLEGEIGDSHHRMKSGDFQIMTAGSGVIHTETIDSRAKMRLLQLWLNLPKHLRWTTPRVQDLSSGHVPIRSEGGTEIRLYSGALAGLASPVKNHVPVIIADIKMQPGAESVLEIPGSYNAFVYMLEGDVRVGEEKSILNENQAGWLDRPSTEGSTEVVVTSGTAGARLVLYAGQPQGDAIVSHGPFIGDSPDDIKRLYQDFRQGKMKHINTVAESQRMVW